MSKAGKRSGSAGKASRANRRSAEDRNERVLKLFDMIYQRTKDKPTKLGELFRLHKQHQANLALRAGSDDQD